MAVNIEQILSAKLGENGSVLRAAFKKTVYIKKYETEVIEYESTLNIGKELNDKKRTKIAAMMQAQLEYAAFISLVYKGQVSAPEFGERKAALEKAITELCGTPGSAPITMDQILAANLGESSSNVRATYKKTICIREFETEVVELESNLDIGAQVSSIERTLLMALVRAQLEYTAFENLKDKGYITEADATDRKAKLEIEINAIKAKAEAVVGTSMDKYF
jgi:hypothetical protein